MSVWLSEAEAAFGELLGVHGEPVEFRRAALTAIVEWNLTPQKLEMAQMVFTERNVTLVEFLKSAVTPPPKAGETFKDSGGAYHDIKVVQRTDLTYRCYCTVGD